MNTGTKIALAASGGYVLGRTKKAKMAVALGLFLAGRKLPKSPLEMAQQGFQALSKNEQFAGLSQQLRGELVNAGKAAAGRSAERWLGGVSDRLRQGIPTPSGGGQKGSGEGEDSEQDRTAQDESEEDEGTEPEQAEDEGTEAEDTEAEGSNPEDDGEEGADEEQGRAGEDRGGDQDRSQERSRGDRQQAAASRKPRQRENQSGGEKRPQQRGASRPTGGRAQEAVAKTRSARLGNRPRPTEGN